MKSSHVTVMLLVTIALLPAARVWAAVDNAAIDAAAREYDRLFQESREAGNRPGMADMGDYVDQAFARIPIDQLTLDQIDHMLDAAPVLLSTKTSAAVDARLEKDAAAKDANGARAAILRLRTQSMMVKSPQRLARLQEALAHPAIAQAISAGYGAALFDAASRLEPADQATARDGLVKLANDVRPDAPVKFFGQAAAYIMSVVKPDAPETAQAIAPLREKLAAAAAEKLKAQQLDEKDHARLATAEAQLSGAYARGALIGAKAPAIDINWFHDPAKPDRTVQSLDELKGKVVVLDFWATWCGPCVASFPRIKALKNYYRGYDVEVIGVTSLQGFHTGPSGRIDTKGNPQKEYSLMPEFMQQKDMTWPVAFSKQPVFNPDYGVMGIPDMVIIDSKGIVRYVGLHPGSKLEDKTAIIDKLLGEGGLMIPAQLLEMKKPG